MNTLDGSVLRRGTHGLDDLFLLPESFQKISIIAHRGAHSESVPENSLRTALEAVNNGFGVELDVRATCDGTLVCFHDASLKRMCGIKERISYMSYHSLMNLSLLRSSSRIPSLDRILEKMPDAPILLHIKSIRTAQVFVDYARKNPYVGRHVVVQAFPAAMSYLRNISNVRLVELHGLTTYFAYLSKGYWLNPSNRRAISVSYNILHSRSIRWFLKNWPIPFSWTSRSKSEVETAQGLGVLPISDWLPDSA